MKKFKDFLKEQPTNSGGFPQAYSQAAADDGPVAGFDKRLFPEPIDDLDQGYQTPGESGLAKWRFSNVYPVMKVTLDNNFGDGPSIDAMVDASKEYTDIIGQNAVRSMKKRFSQSFPTTPITSSVTVPSCLILNFIVCCAICYMIC